MDKSAFRQAMGGQLQRMGRSAYEHKSQRIRENLMESEEWKKAEVIGLTVSRFPEVDTWKLIESAWEQGKTIVVPKCEPKSKVMDFRVITRLNQLEVVYFGLYEPKEESTSKMANDAIDLLVVPGLAFNRAGYRLGFGGGYYDRFLNGFKGKSGSLAFSEQVVENLPVESLDRCVDFLITEAEMINVGK